MTDQEARDGREALRAIALSVRMTAEGREVYVGRLVDAIIAAGYRKHPDPEWEFRARATGGHVVGGVRVSADAAVRAYEEALDRETFEQPDETPLVEMRATGPWVPVDSPELTEGGQ